ncbi:hypothetical protein P3T76_012193 [Phytophthora citrophthora]|uniref:Uncharacterized protein n=1 Tax=Phytophthora citrophthora TaxID=4793 RepID=A0AAD9G688_9STRA|nr:hypothetical protein P3T76_012192 [Phytophthora citrophthora]KAK1932609.1 hypothetical protein P3T76_012193 [Phytophthora citrophthora]
MVSFYECCHANERVHEARQQLANANNSPTPTTRQRQRQHTIAKKQAPPVGLEPTTTGLKGQRSTD